MTITLVDIGIFVTVFFIGLYYYGTRFYDHFKNTDVKHTKPPLPFLGSITNILLKKEDLFQFFKRTYDEFPDERYVGLYDTWIPTIMIRDLELIKQLAVKDFETFHDHRTFDLGNQDDLFASNLFVLKGDRWKEMRAALSPAFTSSKMRNMFDFIEECAKNMTEYYTNDKEVNERGFVEIEVKDSMARYTNDVIASSAFGIRVNSIRDRDNEFFNLGRLGSDFGGIQTIKFMGFALFPKLMKLLNVPFMRPVVSNFFKPLISDAIKNREETGLIRHDLINLLMEAKKGTLVHDATSESSETGFATVQESTIGQRKVVRKWTDTELAAQAFLFFIAGFDTSSTLITFFFYEMLRNPDIQKRLQEEIDEFMLKSEGKLTYNDLQNMKYLDMTISETLRMWPPVGAVDRLCKKSVTLPPPNEKSNIPYKIKTNELISIPIYGLLHDPKYFPDPEKFDPERFSDENKGSIDPITYLPFGVGPRNCIGSRFALLEIKLIAFHMLSKFDIIQTKNTQIPIEFERGTLQLRFSKNGLRLGLKPRSLNLT
ncbi:cytochrome P450 9e2-like [Arctopsyche grandis]|uniref:cytochrome P450 9e2-like n=1 Tax=Arctopsyche grandis TaxID=121162 RepID=UPI00406D8CD9